MDHTELRISLTECGITTLQLGDMEFTLDPEKPVGRGGTCLVYHAMQKDNRGIGRKVILKEFYPDCPGCGGWRDRQRGSLTIPAEESIEDRRKQFFDSYERFKMLFNEEELNMYVVQAHRIPHGNGTDYMVVDYSSGLTFRDYLEGDHSLFDVFTRLRVLALLMEKLHSHGLVHLDLKPENLLCYEDHDVVKLLDTDSFVQKVLFTGREVEIILSGSPGYTAPEVWELALGLSEDWLGCYDQRQDFAELGHRADIFSFGTILYRYLWRDQPPETSLSDCLRQREPYLSGKALRMVKELLEKTLASQPEDRFESMAQLAGKIGALLPLLDPGNPQLAERFSGNLYPVLGREEALALLEQFMKSQTVRWGRIVCISGIGGIGKSALARLFAQRHAGDYDVITEVSAASAAEAVTRITILNWEPEEGLSEDRRRDCCKEMLIKLCRKQKVLLLVNDYDVSSDPDFSIWRELGCDVILTSRHDWSASGTPTVTLKCGDLGDEGARAVFAQYYLHGCETEERRSRLSALLECEAAALKQLLQQVDYHPMTLQLLARYMTYVPGEELGPAEARKVLASAVFEEASPREFQTGGDAVQNKNVYGHLANLFRRSLKGSRFCPEELETLRNMILIPSGLGISAARFRAWSGLSTDWLERLKNRGWLEYLPLQQDVLAEDAPVGVYILPNVLQQVLCREPELSVRMDQMYVHGEKLYQRFQKEDDYPQRQAIMAHMEKLLMLPEDLTVKCLCMMLFLQVIYGYMYSDGQEKARELSSRILRFCEQIPPEVCTDLDVVGIIDNIQRTNNRLLDNQIRPEKLSVADLQGSVSLRDVICEMTAQFEYGDANQALDLAKEMNTQYWSRMDSFERGLFLMALTHMQNQTGLNILEEKNHRVLSDLCRAEMYHSWEDSMGMWFFDVSGEYAEIRLKEGWTEETMTWISQLRDAARVKVGQENRTTGRLEDLLAQGYEYRGDVVSAVACRERAAETDRERLEKAENLLQLSLDYGQLDSEKAVTCRQQALALYNRCTQDINSNWEIKSAEELWQFYFLNAEMAVTASMVSAAMVLLENWLRLACRLVDSDLDVAAWFAAVGNVYEAYGLQEKADGCYRFSQKRGLRLKDSSLVQSDSRWLQNWIDTNIGEYYDHLMELAEEHRFC